MDSVPPWLISSQLLNYVCVETSWCDAGFIVPICSVSTPHGLFIVPVWREASNTVITLTEGKLIEWSVPSGAKLRSRTIKESSFSTMFCVRDRIIVCVGKALLSIAYNDWKKVGRVSVPQEIHAEYFSTRLSLELNRLVTCDRRKLAVWSLDDNNIKLLHSESYPMPCVLFNERSNNGLYRDRVALLFADLCDIWSIDTFKKLGSVRFVPQSPFKSDVVMNAEVLCTLQDSDRCGRLSWSIHVYDICNVAAPVHVHTLECGPDVLFLQGLIGDALIYVQSHKCHIYNVATRSLAHQVESKELVHVCVYPRVLLGVASSSFGTVFMHSRTPPEDKEKNKEQQGCAIQ